MRDPSSNTILLLTSTIKSLQSYIILRLIVLELWWKQTDWQTDRQTDIEAYKKITQSIPVEYLILKMNQFIKSNNLFNHIGI